MDIEEIKKRMGQVEPLREELQPYLVSNETLGFPMLKHPLVFNLFHTEYDNARMNMYYEQKIKSLGESIKKKRWHTYIYLHERPYRLNAFLEINDKLADKQYWELLGEIWTDSENIWQNKSIWKRLLLSKRPHKEYFMSKEDRKVFNNLPENLTIYRGYVKGKNKEGFSYTLDPKRAEWFSKRFWNEFAEVVTKNIKKKDAFAFTNARNENEIIYLK